MESVLKGHLNIKNKTIPAILAQEPGHYVAWKASFCAPTLASTGTYLKVTGPANMQKASMR